MLRAFLILEKPFVLLTLSKACLLDMSDGMIVGSEIHSCRTSDVAFVATVSLVLR